MAASKHQAEALCSGVAVKVVKDGQAQAGSRAIGYKARGQEKGSETWTVWG